MTSQSNLLDLPNELLHKIMSYDSIRSSNELLLVLSCLDARLNAICLPIYFCNRGMVCSTAYTKLEISAQDLLLLPPPGQPYQPGFVHNPYNPISALTLARYIPHIELFDLCVKIPVVEKKTRKVFLDIFYWLCKLLDRLEYVRGVRFYVQLEPERLGYPRSPSPSSSQAELEENIGMKDWAKAYGGLLDKMLEKSCFTLAISHDDFDVHSREFHMLKLREPKVSLPSKVVRRFLKLLSSASSKNKSSQSIRLTQMTNPALVDGVSLRDPCDRWLLRCVEPPKRKVFSDEEKADIQAAFTPTPPALSKIELRALRIEFGMSLFPPCLHWVLFLLRSTCSPATSRPTLISLTLYNICIAGEVTRIVFPLVWSSVPLLKKLCIQGCPGLDLDLIAGFLDACEELEEVVLSGNDDPDPKYPPIPLPRLGKLQKLVAPPRWILYLLQLPIEDGKPSTQDTLPQNAVSTRSQANSDACPIRLPSLRAIVAFLPDLAVDASIAFLESVFKFLVRVHRTLTCQKPSRSDFESFAVYLKMQRAVVWPMTKQVQVLDELPTNERWNDYLQSLPPHQDGRTVDLTKPFTSLEVLWISITADFVYISRREKVVEWLKRFERLRVVKLVYEDWVLGQGDSRQGQQDGHTIGEREVEFVKGLLKESHRGRGVINIEVGDEIVWVDCGNNPKDGAGVRGA